MQRLVYSPSIKVWVKADSGIVDLSPYVTECRIVRTVNQVSSAEIHFRNPKVLKNGKPKFLFTEYEYTDSNGTTSFKPVFHPMDPITIVFERIAGRPIQVFTGYCDTTPYVQLFPGITRITASCTLKRLNHTYWDPGLDFVRDFMNAYGWQLRVGDGLAINEELATANENPEQVPTQSVKLNDSSIGNLLYAVLNEVGGWDNNNLYIQPLPRNIAQITSKLFDEFIADNEDVSEEIGRFVRDIIGVGGFGALSNQPVADGGSGPGPSPVLPSEAPELMQRWKAEADRIASVKTRYVSGGSGDVPGGADSERAGNHLNSPPVDGDGALMFDCSSFVSYMLNYIGKLGASSAPSSTWFTEWAEPGVGKYLTVWAKGPDGPSGHVFFELMQSNSPTRFIGTTGSAPTGHTVAWHSISTAGYTARHIEGL